MSLVLGSRPSTRPRAVRRLGPFGRIALVAAPALLIVALAACGDDDDGTAQPSTDAGAAAGSPAETVDLDTLAAASGDAPAARGAGLDEPPGDPDRAATVAGVGEAAASVTAPDGTTTGCCLLVAATAEQRQRGLMEVTDLGGYQGMVFVFETDHDGGFWMRNTPTPLSIAWFDAAGEFVSATDMAPCPDEEVDCPVYPPEGPYRFAVEVFQGDLDELGIGPGSRLRLGGPCAGATAA